MSARIAKAAFAILGTVLVLAACTSAPRNVNGDPQGPTAPTQPLPAGALGPNPGVGFAWIGNPSRPLTDAELQAVAANNDAAVLDAWNDNYDLAENVREMHLLRTMNPDIRVYLYYNASLFPTHIRGPYLPGFDPSTMALHDLSGNLIGHGTSSQFPDGTSIYVDTTSSAYQSWALDAVTETVKEGYAGVILDSYNNLVLGDRQTQFWINKIGMDKIAVWNAALLNFGHRLVDRLGRSQVIYNGISPTLAGQVDRNLAHLSYLGGAVNEEFCAMYPKAEIDRVDQDIRIMQAPSSGLLLEHLNPGGARTEVATEKLNSFCYAAFLIGYRPGSTYFLSSVNYRADQLDSVPMDAHLQLGNPTGVAVASDGGMYSRRFDHGMVYVNLGMHDAIAVTPMAGVLTSQGRGQGSVPAGGTVTVPGQTAVYLYSG